MPRERLRIKLVRSGIGSTRQQKATLAALGLRRVGHVIERPDGLETQGMIEKVRHLVEVTSG